MSAQMAMNIGEMLMTPSRIVEQLKADFTQGRTSHALVLLWKTGGHAVTPYALYDRGNGRYDVAVYDNNYPDAIRAVHLNTKTQTYRYLVSANPSEPALIATGRIGLVAATDVATQHPCSFCPGTQRTTVTLEPVASRVPIRTRIYDLDMRPLKGVRRTVPLDPWRPGEQWHFPTYTVPANQPFVVRINATKRTTPLTTTVFMTNGDLSYYARNIGVPAGGSGLAGVNPTTGAFVYASRSPKLGDLSFIDHRERDWVEVRTHAQGRTVPAISGRLDQNRGRVVLRAIERERSQAWFKAELSAMRTSGAQGRYVAQGRAALPAGARVIVETGDWDLRHPRRLSAFVVHQGRRIPLALDITRKR